MILSSCCLDKGNKNTSGSINEAKGKNVFIAEYIPKTPHLFIDSVVNIEIENAWLEYSWDYQCKYGFFKRIFVVDTSLTTFIVKTKTYSNYGGSLIVKDTLDCSSVSFMGSGFTEVDILPNQDSVFFYIISDFKNREVLHRFEFHKVDI